MIISRSYRAAATALPAKVASQAPRTAQRALQTSATKSATPLTHPIVPAPPPKAPLPAASLPTERVARKKDRAEYIRIAQNLRGDSAGSNPLRKRFWKEVSVKDTDGMSSLA